MAPKKQTKFPEIAGPGRAQPLQVSCVKFLCRLRRKHSQFCSIGCFKLMSDSKENDDLHPLFWSAAEGLPKDYATNEYVQAVAALDAEFECKRTIRGGSARKGGKTASRRRVPRSFDPLAPRRSRGVKPPSLAAIPDSEHYEFNHKMAELSILLKYWNPSSEKTKSGTSH